MHRSRGAGRCLAPATALVATLLLPSCDGAGAGPSSGTAEDPVLPDGVRWSGVQGEPRATASRAFWDHWGDGRAELSSYRLITTRYGEPRQGELVLIYVTEPHDRRTWIKDDEVEEPHRVNVMKLNASRKFLTGIYPLRELDGPFAGGASWEGPVVPSAWNVRRGHGTVEPVQGRIERSADRTEDGTEVTRFTLRYGEEYRRTYLVERAEPRRVLGWSTSSCDTVRLVATRRLPYWRLNGADGARHRLGLGLDTASSGRPPTHPVEGG